MTIIMLICPKCGKHHQVESLLDEVGCDCMTVISCGNAVIEYD